MIGQTISHYTIIEKLGEGGMGVVYKAVDVRLDRQVAVKFLSAELSASPTEKERFLLEARAASSLSHPSICTVHDIGTDGGRMYLVMELVQGTTLLELAGTLDERACLRIVRQAAEGLGAAHANGIVHRDIKSSNIMRTPDGRIKVMDFGLAKMSDRSDLTTVGSTVGTMGYLPPEQARGEAVDRRADIYSLGVVLFELLTGVRPFTAPYSSAMLYQILNEEAPVPSGRKPDISPSVDAIVRRCLAKRAELRYQSAEELCEGIDAVLAGGSAPTKVSASASGFRHVPPFVRRRVAPAAFVLVVLLAVLLAVPSGVMDRILSSVGMTTVPEQKHLAVLPVTNIGDDKEMQAVCEGLSETLTSQLTRSEQFHRSLWVVPATEVRRAGTASAEEARRSFGVNLVVHGALQRTAAGYRMTVNLTDPVSVRQISSAAIDVPADRLASLQNETVMKVLEMLHVELHPEMKDVLRSGGTSVPEAFEWYLRGKGQVQRYESEANIDDAIISFRRAVRADSGYALAEAALGEAYWRRYESGKDVRWVKEAVAACRRALAMDAHCAPAAITLGMLYTGTGKADEAVALFEAALRNDPSSSEAHRGLAKAYETQGALSDAERTYRRSIELRPDYWGGYNDLGVFYSKNNRYDEAIEAFRKVIDLTPDNDRGYNNLGGMYYFLERWSDAREMFERSYGIRPAYRASSNLGTLYYVEGRFTDAARWYEKALTFNASDYVVTGNLASAYYWSTEEKGRAGGMFAQAIALARRQLTVNRNDPEAMAFLGGYYAMTGNRDSSRFFTERSLRSATLEASIMFQAGSTYERLGDRRSALDWIGRALEAGYSVSEVSNQPELRGLYADPRFTALVDRGKRAH